MGGDSSPWEVRGSTVSAWHSAAVQPGEVEVETEVARLVARVHAAPPRLGTTRLVIVDGPAGSGKTTLARRLAAHLDAPIVHLDDLYEGWAGPSEDLYRRLLTQVLDPIATGRTASYQRYDWGAQRFAEWVEVPRHPVLVLEGVGAGALAVEANVSLRVWVEAPPDVRLARGVARDGEELRPQWLRWVELEDEHFRIDRTRERTDVIVDGTTAYA